MKKPFGLDLIESCISCKLREERLFCNLHGEALDKLERLKYSSSYSEGSVLFVEGQEPRGVMILCQGRVKLSMTSPEGKILILKIAEPGEVLGLSANVSGLPHETTAETLDPVQVNVIKKEDFHAFLNQYPDVCMHAVQELSNAHISACKDIRTLTLSESVTQRVAKLLLDWDVKGPVTMPGKVRLVLTHEEMAQLLGTAREVVTRIFTELRKKGVIETKGSLLIIRNRRSLEKIAGN